MVTWNHKLQFYGQNGVNFEKFFLIVLVFSSAQFLLTVSCTYFRPFYCFLWSFLLLSLFSILCCFLYSLSLRVLFFQVSTYYLFLALCPFASLPLGWLQAIPVPPAITNVRFIAPSSTLQCLHWKSKALHCKALCGGIAAEGAACAVEGEFHAEQGRGGMEQREIRGEVGRWGPGGGGISSSHACHILSPFLDQIHRQGSTQTYTSYLVHTVPSRSIVAAGAFHRVRGPMPSLPASPIGCSMACADSMVSVPVVVGCHSLSSWDSGVRWS